MEVGDILRFTSPNVAKEGLQNALRVNPDNTIQIKHMEPKSIFCGLIHWYAVGYSNMRFLPWFEGHISYIRCDADQVISGPFSGCHLVKFRYDDHSYIAHIGTTMSQESTDRVLRAWWVFASQREVQLDGGYQPTDGTVTFDQKLFCVYDPNSNRFTNLKITSPTATTDGITARIISIGRPDMPYGGPQASNLMGRITDDLKQAV